MKRCLTFGFLALLLLGCSNQPPQSKILAKVNNYTITQKEFEEEFKQSPYIRQDTVVSRTEFLNYFIGRKLILQDAGVNDLDKDKDFLKMIEKYWEQSLLKLTLDRKTKEIAGSVFVSDKEIEEAYNRKVKEKQISEPYQQSYAQIKWQLQKEKESQKLSEWLEALRKKSSVYINNDLLKPKK